MSYDSFDTSQSQGQPIELYEFNWQATYRRYTSAAKDVIIGVLPYLSAPGLSRSNFSSVSDSYETPLTIEAPASFEPAWFFRNQTPSAVMDVKIFVKHEPDSEIRLAWMGRVLTTGWAEGGTKTTLTCEPDLASFRRNIMGWCYQRGCRWALYEIGCELNATDFMVTSNSFSVTGKAVNSAEAAAFPPNWFAGGFIEYVNGVTGLVEYHAIRSSLAGTLNLALVPLGLSLAAEMNIYAGCDHTMQTCHTKFANRARYGGQPSIPDLNPMAGAKLF